jgi:hypothetical protein
MTGEGRIVPPEEARAYFNRVAALKPGERTFISNPPHPRELAYTVAVLGEQRDAVLALIPTRNPELIAEGYAVPASDILRALGVEPDEAPAW